MVNTEQITNGIVKYVDCEVIPMLTTSGKWVMGTAIAVAVKNAQGVIQQLQNNEALRLIGAVNQDGLFDLDTIAQALRQTADRYGKLVITLPIIGSMGFTSADVETLAAYIRGER